MARIFRDIPIEPEERLKGNPRESIVCLSGMNWSKLSLSPELSNERTNLKGGFIGIPFLSSFF